MVAQQHSTLACSKCNMLYIGETGRHLGDRTVADPGILEGGENSRKGVNNTKNVPEN